ncbi:UNVERIFIED_CONTAM: hypothetical protein Sradi_6530800 [Sesamum radiatum]|uniref:Uncharacterized protein n=1 Tax=Sesamum radiatum TaxID=300843 RepID=A0AAW2JWG1_SESRA
MSLGARRGEIGVDHEAKKGTTIFRRATRREDEEKKVQAAIAGVMFVLVMSTIVSFRQEGPSKWIRTL